MSGTSNNSRLEHPAVRKHRIKYSLKKDFPSTEAFNFSLVIIYILILAFFTAMLVLGCIGIHDMYKKDLTYGKVIYSVAATLVFVGVTGILISILALVSLGIARREILLALVICLSIMTLFLIAFLIFIIALTITEEDYSTKSEQSMIASIGDYHTSGNNDKVYWDRLQQSFNCCGANSYQDWDTYNQIYSSSAQNVPESCCIKNANGVTTATCQNANNNEKDVTFYSNGCYKKLKSYAVERMPVVAGVTATTAFLTIFSLILSGFALKNLS